MGKYNEKKSAQTLGFSSKNVYLCRVGIKQRNVYQDEWKKIVCISDFDGTLRRDGFRTERRC
jgi:hypothetical protein